MAAVPLLFPALRSDRERKVGSIHVQTHRSAESRRFRLDTFEEFAFLVVLERSTGAEVVASGRRIPVPGTPKQVLLVPPGSRTEWVWAGAHALLELRIPDGIPAWSPAQGGADFWLFRFRQDQRLAGMLLQLSAEAGSPELGSQFSAEALAQLIRVHLCRRGATLERNSHRGGLQPRRLQAVLQWIDANLSRAIVLSDMSRVAGLSPQHFCRMFKQSVGVTPHRYVTAQRVERAHRLLAESGRTLVEVALETGFPSQSHFGCTFRKFTGMTPGQFRSQL